MTTHPAVSNGSYDVMRLRQDFPALSLVIAALTTAASSGPVQPPDDCLKGNGNHMMSSIATE